jgi:hypothetical protein
VRVNELVRFWDGVVADFLNGSTVPPAIRPWYQSYRGHGEGEVTEEALPEPYLGCLSGGNVLAVFLGLNPGEADLNFQGRDGIFANDIRRLGSYGAWAKTQPYLGDQWTARKGRNRHHWSRLGFMRRWFNDASLSPERMATFELFPWHSAKVTAVMRPDEAVVHEYIWEPICSMGKPVVFAFGAPWFPLLEPLGVEIVERLGRGGRPYETTVKDRSVILGKTREGVTVIAAKHTGSASPPSAKETAVLREVVGRIAAR